MAYGLKYTIPFLSTTGLSYSVNLLLKNYTGSATTLTGGPDPFILNYQSGDDNVINAIRASEATITYYSLPALSEFYSEDDQAWKIEFMQDTDLLWTGFLVQDDCREEFQDAPYIVTLRATDNIGLLKDIPFDEGYRIAGFKDEYFSGTSTVDTLTPPQVVLTVVDDSHQLTGMDFIAFDGVTYKITGGNYVGTTSLVLTIDPAAPVGIGTKAWTIYSYASLFKKIPLFNFIQAGLASTGIALPFHIYNNLFETTEDDTGNMFQQEHLFAQMFMTGEDKWESCYNVIESILTPLNATLLQAEGKWIVIRQTELKLFANAIPGTAYAADFTTPTAITLSPDFPIGIDNVFINADAEGSILRPFKFVSEFFKFEQVKELLINANLKRHGDLLYPNHYDIISEWTNINNSVVTLEYGGGDRRVIFIDTSDNVDRWLRFNPIEVVSGSIFNFTVDIAAFTDDDSVSKYFHTRFFIVTASGDYYILNGQLEDNGTLTQELQWLGPFSLPIPFSSAEVVMSIPGQPGPIAIYGMTATFDLSKFLKPETIFPGIPANGMLLIELGRVQFNAVPDFSFMQNMKITFDDYIQFEGQQHKNEQVSTIKKDSETDIDIDDTLSNVLAGTLFTSALTTFAENIGDINYTKTVNWHRPPLVETRTLGDIITLERSQIQSKIRTIVEGSIYFNNLPSPLSVFQVNTLPDLNLISGVMKINYMQSTCNLKLLEIYESGVSDAVPTYTFEYIKELL